MYTDKMKMVFHAIAAPKNFSIEVFDNENFICLRADPKKLILLGHDEKIEAVQYMFKVKKALEDCGALVILVREALEDGK